MKCTKILSNYNRSGSRNAIGARGSLFFGFMSTAMVCVVSILTNTMQKTHELTSFQMLLNVAPVEGLMLLVIGPVWDYWIIGETAYGSYVWSRAAVSAARPLPPQLHFLQRVNKAYQCSTR